MTSHRSRITAESRTIERLIAAGVLRETDGNRPTPAIIGELNAASGAVPGDPRYLDPRAPLRVQLHRTVLAGTPHPRPGLPAYRVVTTGSPENTDSSVSIVDAVANTEVLRWDSHQWTRDPGVVLTIAETIAMAMNEPERFAAQLS